MTWRKRAADAAERVVLGRSEQQRQQLERDIRRNTTEQQHKKKGKGRT